MTDLEQAEFLTRMADLASAIDKLQRADSLHVTADITPTEAAALLAEIKDLKEHAKNLEESLDDMAYEKNTRD